MKNVFDANLDSIRNLACFWDKLYLSFSISRNNKLHHKKQSFSFKTILCSNWNEKLKSLHNMMIAIELLNQLWQSINKICTYLWLVHKNGLDAVANHWTWSQSWSLLYMRPASFLILIQVLKWSPYALNSLHVSYFTQKQL